MQKRKLNRRNSFVGAVAAGLAALAMLTATAGVAQAAEHQFCWGANLAPGNGCQSGYWNMTGGYANSSNGIVCLNLSGSGLGACDHAYNEGIYVPGYGYYGRATIYHFNSWTIKVYGVFWT